MHCIPIFCVKISWNYEHTDQAHRLQDLWNCFLGITIPKVKKQTNKKIQNTISVKNLINPSNVKVREGDLNNLKNNKFCDTLPVDIFVDKEYVKLMWEKHISLVSFKRPPQEHTFSNQECALTEMPILDSLDRRVQWLTVSNTADKSSRTRADDGAAALAVFKASGTDNRAVSVE